MAGVYINFLERTYGGRRRILLFAGNQQNMSLNERESFVKRHTNDEWLSLEVIEVLGRNNMVSKGFMTQNGPGQEVFLVPQPELIFLNEGIGYGIYQLLGISEAQFLNQNPNSALMFTKVDITDFSVPNKQKVKFKVK
jgi:hypothetical protein